MNMYLDKLCGGCPHWKYKMQEDKAGTPISMERYCPARENRTATFAVESLETGSPATLYAGRFSGHSRRIICKMAQRYVDVYG